MSVMTSVITRNASTEDIYIFYADNRICRKEIEPKVDATMSPLHPSKLLIGKPKGSRTDKYSSSLQFRKNQTEKQHLGIR